MAIDTLFWEMTGQDLPEGKGALLPKGDMVKGKGPKGKGHAAPPPLPWAAPPGAPRPSKGEGPKTKGKAKGGKGWVYVLRSFTAYCRRFVVVWFGALGGQWQP